MNAGATKKSISARSASAGRNESAGGDVDVQSDRTLARLAKAVAHPARARIVRILAQRGECVCGELVEALPLAQSTVSQHLKVLKKAGFIRGEVEGPRICYCIEPGALRSLGALVQSLETSGTHPSRQRTPTGTAKVPKGQGYMEEKDVIQKEIRQSYGRLARKAGESSCCGPVIGADNPITSGLYGDAETTDLPAQATAASLGCGNPTALADLRPGETVLDLGSGGGIDVLLSARRVGPTGKAYGLDMTDEMLELARENQRKSGLVNVEFLKGEIEEIPLPDSSIDVIVSNCVINLSADKDRVMAEATRVLKPGGRMAVSDLVWRGSVPDEIRRSLDLQVGCIAGALEESDYRARLAAAGFEEIEIEPTRVFSANQTRKMLAKAGIDPEAIAAAVDGKFFSAFIRARKPTGV